MTGNHDTLGSARAGVAPRVWCRRANGARKLMDVSRLSAQGWQARTELSEGIRLAYASAPFNSQEHA